MSNTQQLALSIQPIISYPHQAQVGKTYLMTIDLQSSEDEWPYEEEEYPIYCMLDTSPLFSCQPLGEPAVVLHRFGGSYGAAEFLLTAAQEEMQGEITVTLVNAWGVPIRVLSLGKISVTQVVTDKRKIIESYKRETPVSKNYWRNPYIVTRAIHEPEKFFGREDLFAFIEDNLNNNIQIQLLHGQRRIGKSSVLKQVSQKITLENRENFVFICFDLEAYSQSSTSDIIYNLAEEICQELDLSSLLSIFPNTQINNNLEIFDEIFLPTVCHELGNKKLVLLLDESDMAITSNNTFSSFFQYLQTLLIKQKKIFIIPVLGRFDDDVKNIFQLFNSPLYQKIDLLYETSARRLITNPAQGILRYEEEAIKAIFELSSGHPYFTQGICFRIFLQAKVSGKSQVNRKNVDKIVDETIDYLQGGLVWFWDGLSFEEKVFFAAVTEVQKIAIEQKIWLPEDPFTRLKSYGVVQTEEIIQAPKKLVNKGYLDDTERRVKIELVRRWLVKSHPLNREILTLEKIKEAEIKQILEQEIQLYRHGNSQDLIDLYEKILELNPNHFTTISVLAQKYWDVKNFDKALELYNRVYQANPIQNKEKLLQAREAYGEHLRKQGELIKAKIQFEGVLEIEPDRESAKQQILEINAELENQEASQIEVENQLINSRWFWKLVAGIRRRLGG
ncbi:MAG: hypothetical protein PUP90_27675 [Nostoc sp. S4]|nr:hypothetical protein [Nostoc sp. S4]